MKKLLLVLSLITLITGNVYATSTIGYSNAITNGITADGDDIQENLDEVKNKFNTHSAATTGEHGISGTIAGTTDTQTLTNKTLGASTISGDMTFGTGVKAIFGNAARYIKDNTSVYAIDFGTHTVIPATANLYLDGGSDTYIDETSANTIRFAAGGTDAAFMIATGIAIPATLNLYLDGGGNTYIDETSADTIRFAAGGVDAAFMIATGIAIPSTLKLYLDGGSSANAAISNASGGTSSTALYIGNETIDTTASDQRLKKNIEKSKVDVFKLLNKMEIKDFDWLEKNDRSKRGRDTGLIAQEVYKYLPQVVKKPDNPNDMWSVEYSHLVPYLIRAVQEQQVQIDALTKRIEKLEQKVGN